MKIIAWLQMSILVALVISWPLVLGGMSKGEVGLLSLFIGAVLMLVRRPKPPASGHAAAGKAVPGEDSKRSA